MKTYLKVNTTTGKIFAPIPLRLNRGQLHTLVLRFFSDEGVTQLDVWDATATVEFRLYHPDDLNNAIAGGTIATGDWTRDADTEEYRGSLDLRTGVIGSLANNTLFAEVFWNDSTVPTGDNTTPKVHVVYGGSLPESKFDKNSNKKVDLAERAESVEWEDVQSKPSSYPSDLSNLTYQGLRYASVGLLKAQDWSEVTDHELVYLEGKTTRRDGYQGFYEVDKSDTTTSGDDEEVVVANDDTRLKRFNPIGEFSARLFITSGSGTSGSPWVLSSGISAFKNLVFDRAGYYQLGGNLSYEVNDVHLRGVKGAILDIDGNTFEIKGEATATSTTLDASATRGSQTLSVADESGFSEGDYISVEVGDDDEFDEANVHKTPRELNVITATASGELTLKYPLSRDYEYDAGWTNQATVTKVTVRENIKIEGLEFIGGSVDLHYLFNVSIIDVKCRSTLRTYGVNRHWRLEVQSVQDSEGDASVGLYLSGITDLTFDLYTWGAKDTGGGFGTAIRFFGCNNCRGPASCYESEGRDIWIYGSENVHCMGGTIISNESVTDNIELLLFDYCGNCSFQNYFSDAPNKTTSVNLVEFRYNYDLCRLINFTANLYSQDPINIKHRSAEIICENLHLVVKDSGNSGQVFNMNNEAGGTRSNSIWKIHNVTCLTETNSDVTFFGMNSSDELSGNIEFLEMKDILFQRRGGVFFQTASRGSSNAYLIIRVNIENIYILDPETTNGSEMRIFDAGVNVGHLSIIDYISTTGGNRRIEPTGVSSFYFCNVRCGSIQDVDWSKCIGYTNVRAGDFDRNSPQEEWDTISYGAGWSDTTGQDARIRMDQGDQAVIFARVLKSSTISAGDVIGTVPSGLEPAQVQEMLCNAYGSVDPAIIRINTNGNIEVEAITGTHTEIFINGRYKLYG